MKGNNTFSIVVSGKGGVGKTNISAMLVRKLSKKGKVLAIDADPDSNLPQALGVNVDKDVGKVREIAIKKALKNRSQNISQSQNAMNIFGEDLEALVEETDSFDIVVMGRSEGVGCYCGINHIIRRVIDVRATKYDYTVIDCEAGLEHLSRRTTNNIDLLVTVTDPSLYGLMAVKRIFEMTENLLIDFDKIIVIANKITDNTREHLDKTAKENGIKIDAYIPYVEEIADLDARGGSTFELSECSEAYLTIDSVLKDIAKQ